KGGLLCGLLCGALQVGFGAYILMPLQGRLGYGFAFTVLGLAGIFACPLHNGLKAKDYMMALLFIMSGMFLRTGLRFLIHFYAGVSFRSEVTTEGMSVWYYSLAYNATYMLPSFILCSGLVFFLFRTQPRALLKTV